MTLIPTVTYRGQDSSSYRLQTVSLAFLFKSASLNLRAGDMKCPRSQKYLRNANNLPVSVCFKISAWYFLFFYCIKCACSCSASEFMPTCVFQEGREWLLKSVALWLPGHKHNAASSCTDADAQVSVSPEISAPAVAAKPRRNPLCLVKHFWLTGLSHCTLQ